MMKTIFMEQTLGIIFTVPPDGNLIVESIMRAGELKKTSTGITYLLIQEQNEQDEGIIH